MTNRNVYLGVLGLGFLGFAMLLVAFVQRAPAAHADSLVGDYGTTTSSAMASGNSTIQLKNGSTSVLESVVISSSSPATTYPQIIIYDASSTMATSTSRVLAKFGTNNQTMATYQMNVAATYGLKMEVAPGYNGNATVTWR